MGEKYLAERFANLWRECANGQAPAESVWQQLQQHYQEPHRHYHTLAHLAQCLELPFYDTR